MQFFDVIQKSALFAQIETADLQAMLACLDVETKTLSKNEIVLLAGDTPKHVGLVLAGNMHILKEDLQGNRMLLAELLPGELFAEALCCAGVAQSPVTVMAAEASTVLLLRFERILHTCAKSCAFHQKLIENMLGIVAKKNLQLQSRLDILASKSVRQKVLQYLQPFAEKQGANILIPFNREELADFLCVERSALSHELARMKSDGLLDYKKNRFVLHSSQSTDTFSF